MKSYTENEFLSLEVYDYEGRVSDVMQFGKNPFSNIKIKSPNDPSAPHYPGSLSKKIWFYHDIDAPKTENKQTGSACPKTITQLLQEDCRQR